MGFFNLFFVFFVVVKTDNMYARVFLLNEVKFFLGERKTVVHIANRWATPIIFNAYFHPFIE